MQNRILAVDPGYDRVGVAVFEGTTLLHSECFVPPKGEFPERLHAVHVRISEIIEQYAPTSLAIETLFFTKNQKTAIKVAEARGVIQQTAAAAGVSVVEYSPQTVKIAVTGSGNAEKSAVMRMVEKLIPLSKKKRIDDEYDAIALGIAHTANLGFLANITRK